MDVDLTAEITARLDTRQELLETLVKSDLRIRALLLGEGTLTPPLDLVPLLLDLRDALYGTQTRYEEQSKAVSVAIRDAIAASGLQKYETATHVAQILYPAPRQTIDREKLLLAGVAVDIIAAATKESPVAPFLRVDRRKEKP